MYKTELLKKYQLSFCNDEEVCKRIHRVLVESGYEMPFMRSEELSKYMDHLNHATSVLNPELGSRKSSITKGRKRIEKRLEQLCYQDILADASLDR